MRCCIKPDCLDDTQSVDFLLTSYEYFIGKDT